MPTVYRVAGYRFFFFSREGTEPPHIHVDSAGRYAKFWLSPVALSRSVGYNAKEIRHLRDLIAEHREEFQEKWNEYFSRA